MIQTHLMSVLLREHNPRLFEIGRHAAKALCGELTYVVHETDTLGHKRFIVHFLVKGDHKRAMLRNEETKLLDTQLVNLLTERAG